MSTTEDNSTEKGNKQPEEIKPASHLKDSKQSNKLITVKPNINNFKLYPQQLTQSKPPISQKDITTLTLHRNIYLCKKETK
jgi:hypothetical protein